MGFSKHAPRGIKGAATAAQSVQLVQHSVGLVIRASIELSLSNHYTGAFPCELAVQVCMDCEVEYSK